MGLITGLIKASLLLFSVSGFALAGINKVTDSVSKETYAHMHKDAANWYSVQHPQLKQFVSKNDFPTYIGFAELAGAFFLLFPGFHSLGSLVLLALSGGAIYTEQALGRPPIAPAVLGGAVLLLTIMRRAGGKSKRKTA